MLQITQARVNNKLTTENSFLFSCYVDLIAKEETFVHFQSQNYYRNFTSLQKYKTLHKYNFLIVEFLS